MIRFKYRPSLLDRIMPPSGELEGRLNPGDEVVKASPPEGYPANGTDGLVCIRRLGPVGFVGIVHKNSLEE